MATHQGTRDTICYMKSLESYTKTILNGGAKCCFSNELEMSSLFIKLSLSALVCLLRFASCIAWTDAFCSLVTQREVTSSLQYVLESCQATALANKTGSGERKKEIHFTISVLSKEYLSIILSFLLLLFLLWPPSIKWMAIFIEFLLVLEPDTRHYGRIDLICVLQ